MDRRSDPIGFFDSGLGGISVLRKTVKLFPQENYLYFGDSLHAPYGVRTAQEVRGLTLAACRTLVDGGCKALVIACNTATSAAIQLLREEFSDIPVIGIEPAIKPAAEKFRGGRVLMMATPMTVREEKFNRLREQYADQAEIIPVACPGLMEFVERGILRGELVESYLTQRLTPYLQKPVDAVVLGCTHYPFLRSAIRRVIGAGPEIIDGSTGVALQLMRKLEGKNWRNPGPEAGRVEFRNSVPGDEMLALSRALLDYEMPDA